MDSNWKVHSECVVKPLEKFCSLTLMLSLFKWGFSFFSWRWEAFSSILIHSNQKNLVISYRTILKFGRGKCFYNSFQPPLTNRFLQMFLSIMLFMEILTSLLSQFISSFISYIILKMSHYRSKMSLIANAFSCWL